MKNLSLRIFETVLFLFSLSVILTMYSMASEDEESTLLGFNYGYYLLPLFAINVMIVFVHFKTINVRGFSGWILAWLIIVTMNIVAVTSSNKVVNLIRVNVWTTSFFSAYILAKTNLKTIDSIIRLFIVVYVISFVFFWLGKIYQQDNLKRGIETSTNAIYCLISIVPILMLSKNNKLKLIILLVTLVCAVFSNKRGASIIMAFAIYPVLNDVFSKAKSKILRNFLIVAVGAIAVFAFFYIGDEYLGGRLVDRFAEMEETGGSGRSDLWAYVIYNYKNSSLLEQIIGHGHYAVSGLGMATAAHNDFLEVIYDYGIVGLIVYIPIHFYLLRKVIMLRKSNNLFFFSYITMYLVFFVMSMVSILIVQQRYLVYMAVFWGMLEGCNYRYVVNSEKKNDNKSII